MSSKRVANLTVSTQQSRFQPEVSGAFSKEIVVKDLTITLGSVDLLSHASFQLQPGRHYVLHGRNGVGKSTLLRAMDEGKIASFPRGLRVLLLSQTQVEEDLIGQGMEGLRLAERELASAQEMTVLEFVVKSNVRRGILKREAERLSDALGKEDMEEITKVYRLVFKERVERKLEEARMIAERRSGARGATARRELNKVEDELAKAEENLQGTEANVEDARKAEEMLAEIQSELEMMSASTAETQARSILLGLGFSEPSLSQPRSTLSGGWRTRSLLACALAQTPIDLLLLDEPTNFLDLPSILWLETYLTTSLSPTTTLILTTHDRAFADATAEDLLVLRAQTLTSFKGNLSSYELSRLRDHQHKSRLLSAQEKQKAHMRATIAGNISAAKRAGDDKKLKQAASRRKKLEERTGLQISAKGTRFKLNRDLPGYHATMRAEIELPEFDPLPNMIVPGELADLRFPGALVSLEKVGFGYVKGGAGRVLKEVDLTVHAGDRVGICGLNGSGKSTLVGLITGEKTASEGSVTRHSRGRIGVYTQQAVEELEGLGVSNKELTALALVMEENSSLQEKEARGLLSGLGLVGRTASDVPISLLSGGQKVRLALAKLFANGSPHLLILDEVTTHLDSDTIQALIVALKSYEGAIVVITHDRFFMRCAVEGESMKDLAVASRPGDEDEIDEDSESDEADQPGGLTRVRAVYRLSKGKLSKLERGMEQYEEIAARSATKLGKV